jgi:molybdenum cofactor cytidylyltransferase
MSHSTSIIVLAAGGSSRMGTSKQLLTYNGSTLIQHTIEIALGAKKTDEQKMSDTSKVSDISVENIYVVLGANAEPIQQAIKNFPVKILINHEWREGISSSIRCGIAALPPKADAALFLLCDQPLVTAEHLRKILDLHTTSDAAIIASAYSGITGVPALFTKALFPELLKLTGDEGARRVIRAHEMEHGAKGDKEILTVPFPDAAFDVDELKQLRM